MLAITKPYSYLIALCCSLLCACSPALNWREVRNEQADYTLLLPDKPASASKSIELAGQKREMHMQGAQAAGMQFVIAYVSCEQAQQAQLLAAMQEGILLNLHSSAAQVQQLEHGVLQIPPQTARSPQAWLKFFAAGRHCYQMLLLGPAQAMTEEVRDTFFTSFKSHQASTGQP